MKLLNFKSLFAALVLAAMAFSACSESTSPAGNNGNAPNAPTKLMATSKDANSILISWTPSTSESNTDFAGYWVTVTPGLFQSQLISKGQNPFSITNLTEGTVYTITVAAQNSNGDRSTAATVIWSPASRFQGSQALQVYSYNSSKGSGINLWDASANGPKVLTVANKAQWDLGFDDQNGMVKFGSASQVSFGSGTPTSITEVSTEYFPANSLDETFDSQAMDTYAGYSQRLQDMTVFTGDNKGVVLYVRTKDNSSAAWHYAKVLIKRNTTNNSFVFGSGNDKYLNLEISYQNGENVPYARPRF